MTERTTISIHHLGPDLAPLIDKALGGVFVGEAGPGEATFLLGFDVEASEPRDLLARAIGTIAALLEDHQARPLACSLSGLHETDTGHRLWGTIECVGAPSDPPSTRVDQIRVERAPEGWSIEALVERGGER